MLSSLRATAEPGTHMEPSGVGPSSLDDRDSDLDSRACQAGQSNQESRTKYVVHASWNNSQNCQISALKPSPDFCVVYLRLRVELEWTLGLMVYIMDRCLLSLQLVLKNQRPILTLWNQLLLVLPFLEKKVFLYTDDLVNDSSPITLSN